MATESELSRLNSIAQKANIIYGLENVNPIIEELLDEIALDMDWLIRRLNNAWSTVEAYQEELRLFNK
jgi:hypothetical protein